MVGEGDTYEEALADVQSAIRFHIETFGEDALDVESPVLEAFVAAVYLFALLLMVYAVVPDRWLRWADGDLKWRSDKIGIPLGGLGIGHYHIFGMKKPYLLFHKGITFGGRGKINVSAKTVEDIIVATMYIVFLVAQAGVWLWWQRRGKQVSKAVQKVSAYGRPLVRST